MLGVVANNTSPAVSTLEEYTLSSQKRDQLPHAYHANHWADMVFLQTVDMQYGGALLSASDTPLFSAHGRSYTQMHWLLNGLDLTDPATPGAPLLHIPNVFFDTLTFRSLWTHQPGFEWTLQPHPAHERMEIRTQGGGYVGGPSWVAQGFLDRDPATSYGATSFRKRTRNAENVSLLYASPSWGWVMADSLHHQRLYPTLHTSQGKLLLDQSQRHTLAAGGHARIGAVPLEWISLLQYHSRTHEGAQHRFSAPLTYPTETYATHTGVSMPLPSWHGWNIHPSMGVAYASTQPIESGPTSWQEDLTQSWMLTRRPAVPFSMQRLRTQGVVSFEKNTGPHHLRMALRASRSDIWRGAQNTAAMVSTSDAMTLADTSVDMRVYEASQASHTAMHNIRLEGVWEFHRGAHQWEYVSGVDMSHVGVQQGLSWHALGASLGVRWRWQHRLFNMFSLLRADSDDINYAFAQFLDPFLNNGRRFLWNDTNNDGTAQTYESTQALERLGGQHHVLDLNLKRPWGAHFTWGITSSQWGPFKVTVSGTGRWHMQRHTVLYDAATLASFKQVPAQNMRVLQPADTRGDRDIPTHVYSRDLSAVGSEQYVLTNDPRTDFWLGSEIHLYTPHTKRWFLDLGLAGYWNMGAAPFGSFPDRNDPGIIHEASADPNARINDYGRYDQDRSYIIKAHTGVYVWRTLLASMVLRYRDGQPFTRMGVVENLPQGSTAVMLYRRGRLRHTFHMSLDTHLAYTWDLSRWVSNSAVQAGLDVFNILHSGVEVLENPVGGADYRQALEMIPGRTLFVTLSWLFSGR